MQHYLAYQHNVQRLFREHRDKYSGVIIPLSIATAFPSGTYGFVRALCASDTEKQYAIDPRNALFQKAWNRSNVRDPHRRMAAALGAPYTNEGLSRALEPRDFEDESILEQHVRSTMRFQEQFCQRSEDARKLEKYKKLLGLEAMERLCNPQHLIPPYYEFNSMEDPWLDVSKRCIDVSLKHAKEIPVRPVMHFSDWKSVEWTDLLRWLEKRRLGEFWFYPNDFHEHDEDIAALKAYRLAVEESTKHGLRAYSLFGGYFAVLMAYFGLEGFSNGVGYGEWRDSGYHRGGTAATRIYLLKLHRYVDSAIAQSIVERDPDYFGCDTEIIAGYVESGDTLVNMDHGEALDHFMECRQAEIEYVSNNSVEWAVSELGETTERLQQLGELEYERYGSSLTQWAEVISQ